MSDKLISLTQLQEYKTYADAKYQNKLTAGSNISINNNTISKIGAPTFSGGLLSGTVTLANNTVTKVGEITLQPGIYVLQYTCTFPSGGTNIRQCAFSTSDNDLTAFGIEFMDSQNALSAVSAQTCVNAIFEVSASLYPNGRKFYFLAKQNTGSNLSSVMPRAYYLKF